MIKFLPNEQAHPEGWTCKSVIEFGLDNYIRFLLFEWTIFER
jgi:hypothetical protein